MLRFQIERLRAGLSEECFHRMLHAGEVRGCLLWIERSALLAVRKDCPPASQPPAPSPIPPAQIVTARTTLLPWIPVPPEDWPKWAVGVSYFADREDKGVGDTVARLVGPAGGGMFKAWYKETFGKTCGCERRQVEWNTRFPY